MKYIRTKNTIWSEKVWNEIGTRTHIRYAIVKQADDIKELCDGFIFKDTEANELHLLNKNDGISLLGAALFTETVRGYIETDNGLVYVAKMNKEGEWELI